MDLKEEALLGDRVHEHWYYRAKLAALLKATEDLPAGVALDVGAGAGFFSRALLAAGRAQKAICVDPGYPADSDETVAGRPLQFRRALEGDASDVSLVMMMDVLEHVPDDVGLARDYVERLPSGARVIATVPAFQWMWSGHDVFLEHYRRYDLPQLEKTLVDAGLRIEFGSYFYGAVFPAAVAFRMAKRAFGGDMEPKSDMRRFNPVMNALFWGACRAELPFMRRNRIAGLSVFARAVKD
ncbi:methyltransferase [Chelatococcus sambhunathii]|uniref:Methyltransferase n=1 Tax=Chelatococcus sambhunathii TaxID=363953 RepID=A0ABU1DE55_9HYPH|nr:methyltransferase domain-containing protein [Chelatococcus sambhunathii]MDR4306386.1 methyltransferase [Chelatococcus sambhunathii]